MRSVLVVVRVKNIRQQLYQSIRKKSTNEYLTSILIDAIEEKEFPTNKYTPNKLIESQSKIGWDQLLQGRFSNEWDKTAGSEWTKSIISIIFQYMIQSWDQRNHDRHRTTKVMDTRRYTVKREIERLYRLQSLIQPRDQELYAIPLQDQLQKPTHILEEWCNLYRETIRKSIIHATNRAVQNTAPIDTYFT